MRLIMALADRANQYVDAAAPWKLREEPAAGASSCKPSCTVALEFVSPVGRLPGAGAAEPCSGRPKNCSASRSTIGTMRKTPLVGTSVNDLHT